MISQTCNLTVAELDRAGEAPSTGLTEALVELGFETARLKTGTPARVDARSVDFSGLQAQPGDPDVRWFSFDPEVRAWLVRCTIFCFLCTQRLFGMLLQPGEFTGTGFAPVWRELLYLGFKGNATLCPY